MSFLVAHRAGNDLSRLREVEQLGVALVEADVRLWRGRLEVRHLKTVGPVPLLWDRWKLANPFAPRLVLPALLAAAHRDTELMLDLKGRNPKLARLVLAALPPGRSLTVCARSPRLLAPFVGRPGVRVFQSAGSQRQVRALLRRPHAFQLDGVAVHERLLDERSVAELRRRCSLVLSWPVNSLERARELAAIGVDGLISDDPALLGATP